MFSELFVGQNSFWPGHSILTSLPPKPPLTISRRRQWLVKAALIQNYGPRKIGTQLSTFGAPMLHNWMSSTTCCVLLHYIFTALYYKHYSTMQYIMLHYSHHITSNKLITSHHITSHHIPYITLHYITSLRCFFSRLASYVPEFMIL